MVDLRSLEVFFWVVELGGFGRAAERLHMTQPAVSSRITQLESRFGTRLLDRSSHRAPVPTPKGLDLYAYAERMLCLRAEMLARLAEPADLSGTIRLGAAEALVHTILGALLRELHRRHPRITPEITVDTSPNLRTALLAGELDLALLLGPPPDPRVRNLALCEYDLIWVASPALPLGPGRVALAELARWPILSYARGTVPHAQLQDLFSRADLPPVRLFANSSLATILRLAVDGIGIGILPRAVAAREIAENALVVVEAEPTLPPLRFTASWLASPDSGLAERVAALGVELARPP